MRTSTPVTGAISHAQIHPHQNTLHRRLRGTRASRSGATRRHAAVLVTAILAGVLGTGVAAPATAAEPAPGTAAAALTPRTGLLFGAFVARGTSSQEEAVATFEEAVGRKLDTQRLYRQWDDDLRAGGVASAVERGRTPVLSVATKRVDGTKVSWASIARGDQDATIAAQAATVAGLGVPLYLTFQHEPDYATGYGTAAEYRAAWRHYVQVFRDKGVSNVVWTWIVTPTPFAANATTTADALYPGDDVVDFVGLDVYNWNGCNPGGPTSWQGVATQSTAVRAFAQKHGKPMMVAEWGSVEDPANAQRKATWLRDSMATWTSWPEVKAVLYFHQQGSCPWWADSSPTTLTAFRSIASDAAARTRTTAWLRVSATHGAAPLAVTVDASRSWAAGSTQGSGIASWTLDLGDGSAPLTGTGTPPAASGRTYAAGTYALRLTVTDTAGRTATDRVSVESAPVPTVTVGAKDVTTSTATSQALVDLHGFAGTVQTEWGTSTAYGTTGPVTSVPAVSYVKAVNQPLGGLEPNTTYHVRTTTTTPAGTTVTTSSFETAGKPTSSKQWASGTTATSTTFVAQVHPHRLATTAWIEWGTTTALGQTSPVTSVAALTYEKSVSSGLVGGLAPSTTYYYRVVAQNSAGTLVGPIGTVKTPRLS